ncbi:MAG: hypothetical protein EHM28_14580 [Spirochaetaceae bacterium]|nr:MAG: hypothetical protein EHM28_14580 [Spirochaetaceae bacterium]
MSEMIIPNSIGYTQTHTERNMQRMGEQSAPRIAGKSEGTHTDKKLYDVCVEFEAIFIKQMLNTMRKTVEKSELVNGGYAEEIFEDMLYDEYAQNMAESKSFGLADMIYRDLAYRRNI